MYLISTFLVACSGDSNNNGNNVNIAEMRSMLESWRDQATQYAETLRQNVVDQTQEAREQATEYAERIQQLINEAQSLTPEQCTERLNELRTSFNENPDLGSRIMGFGAEMEANVGTIATGVVMIVAGLFLAYMGRRIFAAFLSISGFVVFATLTIILAIMARPHLPFVITPLAFWGIAIVAGLIGAFVFYKAWKFAVYCIACYGGMLCGFWILGMIPEIRDYVNKHLFIIFCSTATGICARYMDEFIVIVSSSLAGSFTAFVGVDMIKPLGLRANLTAVCETVSQHQVSRELFNEFINGNVRNYMIGVLFVTVTGIYVQYRYQPRSYDRE